MKKIILVITLMLLIVAKIFAQGSSTTKMIIISVYQSGNNQYLLDIKSGEGNFTGRSTFKYTESKNTFYRCYTSGTRCDINSISNFNSKKNNLINTFIIPQKLASNSPIISVYDPTLDKTYKGNSLAENCFEIYLRAKQSNRYEDESVSGLALECGLIQIAETVIKTIWGSSKSFLENLFINISQPKSSNDLVVYYPFNGNANDESGNGYHCTINGAILTKDRFDKSNSAFSFNGQSYLIAEKSSNLHLNSSGFSLVVWFNFSEDNYDSELISKHLYGYRTGYLLGIYQNKVRFYVDKGSRTNTLTSPETYNDGKWHLAVGTFDVKTQLLYVDGELKTSQEAVYEMINDSKICIGNSVSNGGGYNGFYKGKIDDVKIFNGVLSKLDVQQLYHERGW